MRAALRGRWQRGGLNIIPFVRRAGAVSEKTRMLIGWVAATVAGTKGLEISFGTAT